MTSIAWHSHLAEAGCGDVAGPCPSIALDVETASSPDSSSAAPSGIDTRKLIFLLKNRLTDLTSHRSRPRGKDSLVSRVHLVSVSSIAVMRSDFAGHLLFRRRSRGTSSEWVNDECERRPHCRRKITARSGARTLRFGRGGQRSPKIR